MHVSETLRFAVRHILPPIFIVALIFYSIIFTFPTITLTLKDFTFIYWSFSIVSFPLNYQAQIWTEYVIKHYGPQMEKNPTMRKMYIKGDLKQYWISWLGMYLFLFFFYIIGVYACSLLFLIIPSWILAIVLYDFLNDFYWLRKLKNKQKI